MIKTKLLCFLTAFALMVNLFCLMPVSANVDETAQHEEGVYLNQDFEGDMTKPNVFHGASPTYSVKSEENGNKYLEIMPNWGHSGWPLYETLQGGGNDYVIQFDFALTHTRNDIPAVMLCEIAKHSAENDQIYNHFGLIKSNADSTFSVAGVNIPNILYEAGKWYSYKITFNTKSGSIRGKIMERDNENVSSEFEFIAPDTIYGNGMPRALKYDGFKVDCSGTILLDNIVIAESTEIPVEITTVTEHIGNIFDGDDVKRFTVNARNKLNIPVNAEIAYKVIDEDDNIVENGEAQSVKLDGKGKQKYDLSLSNPLKYGTYKIIFDAAVTSDNGVVHIESRPYHFSVINKRDSGENLNKRTQSVVMSSYLNTQEKWEAVKELAMQSGLSGLRTDLRWYHVQLERDKAPDRNLPDAAFSNIAYKDMVESGLQNMAIIGMENPRIYDGWSKPHSPHEIGTEESWLEWEEYVDYITREFKDDVTYWEVINEPNAFMSGTQYAEYLKRAYPIIRKNDPDGIICAFAESGLDLAWMEDTLKVIGNQYLDVVTVHPYDWAWSGEFYGLDNWSNVLRDQVLADKMTSLKALLTKYGHGETPIMFTELSISSTPETKTKIGIATPKAQAAELTQLYTMMNAQTDVKSTYWYSFLMTTSRGFEDVVESMREANFGILGHEDDAVPYAAKPAYVALAGFNKMLTDSEFIDSFIDSNVGTRAYRFRRKDGQQVVVLWTENGSDNIALKLGAESVDVLDKYTNPIGTMYSEEGIYNFTSTFEPIFIVGDFTGLERSVNTVYVNEGRTKAVHKDRATFSFIDSKGRNLRIEAKGTPYARIVECNNIANGKGKIIVETTDEAELEEPIDVRIYDGDNLVYYGRLHLIIKDEAVSISYSLGDEPTGAKNRKVVYVSVTNQTCGKELNGIVNSDFTFVGGKNQSRSIWGIKPKETRTVALHIPKSSYVHSVGSTVKLDFDNGYYEEIPISVIESIEVPYNNSEKTDTTVLNGSLGVGSWFAADDALATSFFTDWRGPQDSSLKGTLRWDEKNLYIYCDVTDDVFYQPYDGSNVWQADGLQLGFQNQNAVSESDSAFTEIAVSLTPNGAEVYRYSLQTGISIPLGKIENILTDIQKRNGGVIYKIVLPWMETIGKETVEAGDSYRFNVIANDNDGTGRRGFAELTKGIGSAKDARLFTTINLSK